MHIIGVFNIANHLGFFSFSVFLFFLNFASFITSKRICASRCTGPSEAEELSSIFPSPREVFFREGRGIKNIKRGLGRISIDRSDDEEPLGFPFTARD